MMVARKKSAAFPSVGDTPPFLGDIPRQDLVVDNCDGVVEAYGLGPYEIGGPRGRDYSQGAGTDKGNVGSASGRAKTMRVKS